MYFEFETQSNNPESARIRYSLIAVAALLLLLFLSIRSVVPSIEKDLIERISTVLIENDLNNILISTSGRDITLEGLVSKEDHAKTLILTSEVKGVRKITDKLTLTNPDAAAPN